MPAFPGGFIRLLGLGCCSCACGYSGGVILSLITECMGISDLIVPGGLKLVLIIIILFYRIGIVLITWK